MIVPALLALVQVIEVIARVAGIAISHKSHATAERSVSDDARYLTRAADSLMSTEGIASKLRSSQALDQRVVRLSSTPKGRAALMSMLDDASPVTRLIAAEAVAQWDASAARAVAEAILAEPRYFDWILERAAADLLSWNGQH